MEFKSIDMLTITECCEHLNLSKQDLPKALYAYGYNNWGTYGHWKIVTTPVTRTEPLNPYTYSGGGTTYYPCERCGGSGEFRARTLIVKMDL